MSQPSWGLLLYAMVGSEEERGLILDAARAMSSALQTDACAIAVQINTASHMERHWISKSAYSSERHAAVDGSKGAELTRFLDEGRARLAAASTALVVWAHGEGVEILESYLAMYKVWPKDRTQRWPKSIPIAARDLLERYTDKARLGPDWGTQQFLSNDDVRSAIAASARGKVELLAFNACAMGMIEVAYELREVTDVLVFSQLFARTWPYGAIAAELSRGPGLSASDLGRLIVSCVQAELTSGARQDAVSAVATASLGALFQAFDAYALCVTSLVSSDWKAVRRAVMQTAQRVHDPYPVDLLSLLGALGAGNEAATDAAQRVRALLQSSVILGNAAPTSHPGLQGVSIFCPKSTTLSVDAAYSSFDFARSKWIGFLRKFQRELREEQSPQPALH